MVITETKFTAGPWAVSKLIGVDDLGIVNVYGSAVARIGNLDIANPANAALIAAAPELYEALAGLVAATKSSSGQPCNGDWEKAFAALAKSGAPA